MVMEGIQEDISDGNMQCINHPYKTSSPGGICAVCLQEKLGKLVQSSFSSAIFPSSNIIGTSSSTTTTTTTTTTSTLPLPTNNKNATDCNNNNSNTYYPYDTMRKSRMQFLLKKKKETSSSSSTDNGIVFKRSKSSTTTPRNHLHFLETADHGNEAYGPHRKGFWSFLHYSSSKHYSSSGSIRSREKKKEEFDVVEEENESPNEAGAFDRKVARSKSVGCGSRSFSGDLFEKISTGLGDCTLRRVESQREGKPRFSVVHHKERVNCGGIFSGFMITSSEENVNGKSHFANGRSKNWVWALASPMRAFSKTSSSGKREESNKNATPNLNAIPSLLTVS